MQYSKKGLTLVKKGLTLVRHEISLSKECVLKLISRASKNKPYASKICSLMYVMLCTIPDIEYAVNLADSSPSKAHCCSESYI